MFTVPAVTPVTAPEELTVALAVLELVQLPPVDVSFNTVTEPPSHTAIVPVIAAGIGLTVIA